MNFTRSIAWSLIDKFTNVGARAVQTIMLARILGVAKQGEFALFLALTTITAILANGGLSVAANYFAAVRADARSRAALAGTLLVVGIPSGLAAGCAAAAFTLVYAPFVKAGLVLRAPIILTVVLWSLQISFASFLFGCARYDYKALCNFGYQLLLSAGLVVGARAHDICLLAWLWTAGMFLVAAALFIAAMSQSAWRIRFDAREARAHVWYGLRSYAFVLSQAGLSVSPVLIVGHLADAASAAIYSIASSGGEVIGNVARAFADVIQQRAGSGAGVGRRTFVVLGVVMSGLALVAAPASYILVPHLLGSDYEGVVLSFWLLLPGLPFLGLAGAACSLMFGRGSPSHPAVASIGTLCVAVPLVAVLTRSYGAPGAALGTAASYAIFLVLAVRMLAVLRRPPEPGTPAPPGAATSMT